MRSRSTLLDLAHSPPRRRRRFGAAGAAGLVPAALLAAALTSSASRAQGIRITDVSGRVVTVPRSPERILIDDGRYLVALSLISPDPARLLAGWPHDVQRIGARTWAAYRTRFPRLDSLPRTPSSAGAFSVEQALAVRPDVAVLSLGRGPTPEQLAQLDAAGVPVVFIDFFSHPLRNMERSLRILGRLTGNESRAAEFIAFRQAHIDVITRRLEANPGAGRPDVFIEAHAGMSQDCCNSPGKGNIGDYVSLVGGHNIGADVLPGASGRVNIEYVIARDPAIYIATGGPHLEKSGGLVLGRGYSSATARTSLAAAARRPGIELLSAVSRGDVHGLSHQLLNSPLDILAVEALAKWIHPRLFHDLDPSRTLATIDSKFLAVPLGGTYWIDLR